jgi:hypothetical protein
MNAFPDTGPQPDGTRTPEQWRAAINEDINLVVTYLADTLRTDAARTKAFGVALARKEALRLVRDIERFAQEVHGIDRDTILRQGPL